MHTLDAIIYGLIQGVTEFFPVSSSGHLALLPQVLELADPGVTFDLLMHLGTALAVMVYFKAQIKDLLHATRAFIFQQTHPALPWLKNFFFSTLASVLLILALQAISLKHARVPWLIGFNLVFFGLIMFWADHRGARSNRDLQRQTEIKAAIWIGLAQALAIFPGVSRSGVTLTMGRFLGLQRSAATHYSFLLSLPIIFAGVATELPQLIRGELPQVSLAMAMTGIGTSFIVGLLAIHFFLQLIERWGLGIFALYRGLLGIAIWTLL